MNKKLLIMLLLSCLLVDYFLNRYFAAPQNNSGRPQCALVKKTTKKLSTRLKSRARKTPTFQARFAPQKRVGRGRLNRNLK